MLKAMSVKLGSLLQAVIRTTGARPSTIHCSMCMPVCKLLLLPLTTLEGFISPDGCDFWCSDYEGFLGWRDGIDEADINASRAINEDVMVPELDKRFYQLFHVLSGDVVSASETR